MIDGDTHTLLGKIPASYRAHGYTFDPVDERWAYNVGRDGWLFKFDLYSLQAVAQIRVGIDSRGIAISDDGKQVWDGKNDAGEPVASGVYFYQLSAEDFSATRRMLIVK